ncbi:hypothetical protein IKF81_01850 [Candidatus Saccharibacteria bacterium]|nr:hypothetical protein [Candidatus Saccharibacteria bacterium]
MAVVVTKEKDNNVELTNRINADLREKMSKVQNIDDDETDFVEDSDYLKEYRKTNRFAWVWIVLIALAIASLVFIIWFS